jgi:putative hemolysin
MMSNKLIDVERLIKHKSPRLNKWLPGFVVRYLKKILHQKEINDFIETNRDVKDEDFCNKVLEKFNVKLNISGTENIPLSGGCIFVANHPLGGMDALAIVSALAPIRKDIKFIVNDVLLQLESLNNMFVGINKFGKNGVGALQSVNDLFASEYAVFIFPAGYVSRKKNGVVRDVEWKKSFVSQAVKFNKPIVPIYLDGELSPFFYRLSNFRKFIGIKLNIEMLYLADELFKQKNKEIKIKIGKAILPLEISSQKSHKQVAEDIKNIVYSLK